MFQQTRKAIAVLAGATGLSLVLGVTAAASLASQSESTDSAAPGGSPEVTAPAADTLAAAEVPAATEAAAAPSETVATAPPTTTGQASAAAEEAPEEAAPVDAPADAPAAQQPVGVARANPSSAQVLQAMQSMKQRIPMLPLNESYGRQFGDKVCSAFDQGSSAQQVIASVVAEASKIPLVSISSGDADFAVRTAVQLFCPGHMAKL